MVLVQCKRWEKPVGVPVVRELLGAVTAEGATRGILAAAGRFTEPARAFARENGIELIDGQALERLIRAVLQVGGAPSVEPSVVEKTTAREPDASPVPSADVEPSRFASDPLGCVPSPSRFSDPELRYAVLYVGSTVRCVLWEALLRDPFFAAQHEELPLDLVKTRLLVTVLSREPLIVLDPRGDGTTRARVPTAVTRNRRHAAGRALSQTLQSAVPETDGIIHDSRYSADICEAVLNRSIGKLEAIDVVPLVSSADQRDALVDDGIALIDVRVLDHLVIGQGMQTSLAERGLM